MDLLLDTHTLIWFFNADEQLSTNARNLVANPTNNCFLSIASIWEMGIKVSLNKLELRGNLAQVAQFMAENSIELLPITFGHVQQLTALPFHHRDPFDRIIIAQALIEQLVLVTKDAVFGQYRAATVWD